MTQTGLINRLVQAAEEWTRGRYHQDVVAVEHSEPESCDDGRIQAVVELDTSQLVDRPQRMRCIATLELDGTVSCVDAAGKPGKNTMEGH